MSDANRLGEMPNTLDMLYHPEFQDKYVTKLRELARQHGQDMFLKQAAEKLPPSFNNTVNLAAISPTPSTSSSTSSSTGSNIRHFKKALILQSNMEDAHQPSGSDISGAEAKALLQSPSSASTSIVADNLETKKSVDEETEENDQSELSIASCDKTAETSVSKITDFSIKSLSSKYSSDDEAHNQSLLGCESALSDHEMNEMNFSKDDSLKAITSSNFDFLRPSTSGLSASLSISTLSIPSPSQSPNPSPCPSPNPSPNASYTTLPQMPTMVTHVGRKPLNGPPCSLKTLVDDNILDPLDGSLTYEILGSKFMGDLLPNGFIRMSGTSQVFANPSSWANYCRSTIASCSKDQKNYGSAWSIIRYLGKRLDSYKLRWYRKQKKQYMGNGSSNVPVAPLPNSGLNVHGKRSADNFYAPQLFNYQSNSLAGMAHLSNMNNNSRSSEMKNLLGYMNRDRLWKLDKISTGDPELNNENYNNENEVVNFTSIDLTSKDTVLKKNTKVSAVPFNSVFCLQPFLVTVCTNVLLLVDFHSHLVTTEVEGYLGGSWDPRTQHLTITQAYPLWYKDDQERESQIIKIKKNISYKGLTIVGWYHSHPKSVPHPTVSDIKRQLKYQKEMLIEYTPVVGLIGSPFYPSSLKMSTLFQMFWVMPLFAQNCRDFGRPMQVSYNITRDAFLTQDLLVEMRLLATHYIAKEEFIKFTETFRREHTYWDKLYESLKNKLPRDLVEASGQETQNDIQRQALAHFWNFLRGLIHA